MSTDCEWYAVVRPSIGQLKHAILCTVCAIALLGAPTGPVRAAAAEPWIKAGPQRPTQRSNNEPFGHIPKGPLQIIISVNQQKLHLYSDGAHVADTLVATGVADHPTPFGVFSVIQKSRYHRSNIYSGAPMPFMHRITWSGVAMHEGVGVGHPASHGCIRMPHEFAAQLWGLSRLGARVIIARPELQPQDFADPHLFVHRENPATPAAASAQASTNSLHTAQTVDTNKTTDATGPSAKDAGEAVPSGDAADPPAPLRADASLPPEAGNAAAAAAPDAASETKPVPPPKPADIAGAVAKAPIAIFVSGKTKKIYVRQNLSPLFDAPITIAQAEQRLGTHVFTALDFLDDRSRLRWNVVSLPDERPTLRDTGGAKKPTASKHSREQTTASPPDPAPSPSPQDALARIAIPREVIDQISQLIVPGSSLIVSDHGLGDETGEGTDFIVITHE